MNRSVFVSLIGHNDCSQILTASPEVSEMRCKRYGQRIRVRPKIKRADLFYVVADGLNAETVICYPGAKLTDFYVIPYFAHRNFIRDVLR